MIRLLSYPIRKGDPAWPGNPTLEITPHESIEKGDNANTCLLHLFNHFGTHLDAPRHFHREGPAIAQLPLDRFFYQKPLLLDIPKQPGELIGEEDLTPHQKEIVSCDLLMLRTGFSRYRREDPTTYSSNGPGVSSAAARFLMDHCPGLKAMALDFVSLASYVHPEEGVLAHQIMLGKFHSHYICVIEDICLDGLELENVLEIEAIPLMIDGVDSAPVTVLARMRG